MTRLDPTSRVLDDAFDDAVRRYADMAYAPAADGMHEALSVVLNDPEAVIERVQRARAKAGAIPRADQR